MLNVHVYYHNDHDGIVSAAIVYNGYMKYFKPYEIKFYFNMIDYSYLLNLDHINFEDNNTVVYFLDYSFSNEHNKAEFEKLLQRRTAFSDVVWIDHHITSMNLFNEYKGVNGIGGIRNVNFCGAALTYCSCILLPYEQDEAIHMNYFHEKDNIPKFLKYIDDYDCWKGLYPETNDFHYGFNVVDPTDDIFKLFLLPNTTYEIDNELNKIIKSGKEVQKYLNFENKNYHVDMYGFEFTLPEEHGGYKCFCLNRKGNSLMFGDKINKYDAVIPFYYNNGKWVYSMFTNKDNVDCSAVAKTYGGGGHLKAAGWNIDEFIFNK